MGAVFLRTLLALLVMGLVACAGRPASSAPPSAAPPTASEAATALASVSPSPSASEDSASATIVAAGDIADCTLEGDSATAALVEDRPDAVVAALGDLVYPSGTKDTFARCYAPTWGAFGERTRPAIGNHDLEADGGAAYWHVFGDRAGAPGEGWYSYDLGAWHVVVLNSNCDRIGCDVGSAQHDWLVADLGASDADCTLAYWHHPRFTSGKHGAEPVFGAAFWTTVADAGAELVLAGHDHHYERFAPMDAAGSPAPAADGLRQFIVGTGGGVLRPAVRVAPGSELIIDDAYGILELSLSPGAYAWSFIGVDGTELDAGSGACHG
jgi:alkaline phosphatase